MKKTFKILAVVASATFLTVGIVNAASEYDITTRLGGTTGDFFDLEGTLMVDSIKIGSQGVGGVTFFNGTIVNSTTGTGGSDNPVTFGDNVRIDGRVYRGATAGTGDTMPFIVNDNMQITGNLTVDGTINGGTIPVTNSAATLTANWVNTAFPWAADEIADVTRAIQLPLGTLFTDADGTPAPITSATTPNLSYAANQGMFLEYAEDDTVDFGGQFVIPSDYASGGAIKAVIDTSGSIVTDWNLDFKVSIGQVSGTAAWSTASANETPVDITGTAGTPRVLTFTPTSQSSFSSGDIVYFDIFPDSNTATGEPNVEIYSLWFEYAATQ